VHWSTVSGTVFLPRRVEQPRTGRRGLDGRGVGAGTSTAPGQDGLPSTRPDLLSSALPLHPCHGPIRSNLAPRHALAERFGSPEEEVACFPGDLHVLAALHYEDRSGLA
jgi:hypothetical protein